MNSEFEILKNEYGISEKLLEIAAMAQEDCEPQFKRAEEVKSFNQLKVLKAFRNQRIAPAHFAPSYGYGYGDIGRDKLEELFAEVFSAEAAIVRPSIASGTHGLAIALFGLLKMGDTCLSASGKPYDTMEAVIGIGEPQWGSLASMGVAYMQLELTSEQKIDFAALEKVCATEKIALVMLQRSRGYTNRNSLSVSDIKKASEIIKKVSPDTIILVDNCYGEFVDTVEPLEAGADIIVGSLIKNPGGGLAPTGAYIAGKADLISKAASRLTSPGIGQEVGSYAASYLPFYQGLYMAPHIVCEALKGAVFTARLFELLGCSVSPAYDAARSCIIQSVNFSGEQEVVNFCKAIQSISPVDSFVLPEPWEMPGYADKVIMAAGTFIQGASLELSADAPIRTPYTAYMQGGLVFEQVKAAVLYAAQQNMLA